MNDGVVARPAHSLARGSPGCAPAQVVLRGTGVQRGPQPGSPHPPDTVHTLPPGLGTRRSCPRGAGASSRTTQRATAGPGPSTLWGTETLAQPLAPSPSRVLGPSCCPVHLPGGPGGPRGPGTPVSTVSTTAGVSWESPSVERAERPAMRGQRWRQREGRGGRPAVHQTPSRTFQTPQPCPQRPGWVLSPKPHPRTSACPTPRARAPGSR